MDNQPCNLESYKLVTSQLMRSYGVSRMQRPSALKALVYFRERPHYPWLEQFNLYWPRPTILNSYTPKRLLPDSSNDYLSRVLPEDSRRVSRLPRYLERGAEEKPDDCPDRAR